MANHHYSLLDIANEISAKVIGDASKMISGLAPLSQADTTDLSYLALGRYEKYLPGTKAAAVILRETQAAACPTTALVVANPELAFAKIATKFSNKPRPVAGIHPSAIIAPTASVAESASIGPYCVIGEDVVIGARSILHAQVSMEAGAVLGDDCECHAGVKIYHHTRIANRVCIESGAVIGRDGFGLTQEDGVFTRIPQLGAVLIEDDVWIGANTCIDRGAMDDTVIETGVKIDNLVQIAHNVRVGAHTVIAGCTGVAGSTVIGKHCLIGGSTAISGHITLCDGVILTGCAMVTASIKKAGVYSSGTGLMPNGEWRRSAVGFRKLGK